MNKKIDILRTRPSWIEINLKNVQENAQTIMQYTGAKKLIAVVKANAYGHGAVATVKALYAIGVRDFAVATIAEAALLRQEVAYDDFQILLLGVQDVSFVDIMLAYHLSPAVGNLSWLQEAVKSIPEGKVLDVQLAIDTGMGRMGAHSQSQVTAMYAFIQSSDKLRLRGVFTHFATADDSNQQYYDEQVANFYNWVRGANIPNKYWHLANSGSALWHSKEIDIQTLRVGSVLYGYNPGAPKLKMPIQLKNVLSLKSRIGFVHELGVGESVSYGATYTAEKPQWVATLPIGYADGYLRRMAGMKVLVAGHVEHVIGRITMDQIVISLNKEYPVDTEVTLIGRDGQEEITVEEFAEYADTIPHEISTTFSARLPRIYD
ncbi:alanine racemase [Leuconostoc sp. MS02]|uniref:Alanine racemase n=1 Tax=Leuconostoc aquikimchii TaxID=3236804 RepID=A0ABV3S2M3_9LACO